MGGYYLSARDRGLIFRRGQYPQSEKNLNGANYNDAVSTIRTHIGDLSKIRRVLKIFGMVNCTPEFERHPYVINGCSELFAAVWGEENGTGVRSAVGFGSLPDNIPVEIEAIFELQ